MAAWYLCSEFDLANYVLRSVLADKFIVPICSTINAASTVMFLLVLGWGFTFYVQLISRQTQEIDPEVDKVQQTATVDQG